MGKNGGRYGDAGTDHGGRDKGDEPKSRNVERGRESLVTLRPTIDQPCSGECCNRGGDRIGVRFKSAMGLEVMVVAKIDPMRMAGQTQPQSAATIGIAVALIAGTNSAVLAM